MMRAPFHIGTAWRVFEGWSVFAFRQGKYPKSVTGGQAIIQWGYWFDGWIQKFNDRRRIW